MDEAIIAEEIRLIGGDGDQIQGYYARPLIGGSRAGVVVLHHSPGWDEITKDIVRRIAGYGYMCIAPNLYSREMKGRPVEEVGPEVRSHGGVSTRLVQADVSVVVDYLRLQVQSNGKVGAVGYSFGGRQIFIAACTLKLDAAVINYGGYIVSSLDELADKHPGERHETVPIDLAPGLSCPMLGLFGAKDVNPSPEHVGAITEELSRLNKEFVVHTYEDAGHGFATWNLSQYHVDAAVDAWRRMIEFFSLHLDS